MSWHSYRGKQRAVSTDWDRPMVAPDESRLHALYGWERRCRGYDLFAEPVALEPSFLPFEPDGGGERWGDLPQPLQPTWPLAFFTLLYPTEAKVSPATVAAWLSALRGIHYPLALEVVADAQTIRYQVTCGIPDADVMIAAFSLQFPEALVEVAEDVLLDVLQPLREANSRCRVVDFGLNHAAYRPLKIFESFTVDPHGALVGALGTLAAGEAAGLQLLVVPARAPWGESLSLLVEQFDGAGRPAHPNTSDNDLQRALRYKLASPLWAAAIRVFGVATDAFRAASGNALAERAFDLCRSTGTALSFAGEGSSRGVLTNDLLALDDEGLDEMVRLREVLSRRSRRTGMVLSQAELIGLWHPPSERLLHPRLLRHDPRRRDLPEHLTDASGSAVGFLDLGDTGSGLPHKETGPQLVRWPDEMRPRHAYLLGATRMGKSTLLLNLIAQDMLAGKGLCLIDPHGDLAADVLACVPPSREKDVLYLDLSDAAFPPAIGLLEASDEWERRLLVSDLLSILHRLFRASWGDRLEHILRHTLLTLLADTETGHTLRDIRPLLSNKAYRERLLETVGDPDLRSFWTSEFPGYSASAFSPVFNKLGLLLSSPVVRNIVAGGESRLEFDGLMQGRKILIVNLAQGLVGEDNAHFLGALLVSKVQLAAMHNLRRGRVERVPFTLYVDEFQNFVVSSFEKILSEAGKAGLTLVMANQFLEQLGEGLQTAILSNVGTMVAFRVSASSGRALEPEFGGWYGAKELTDLERGQAVIRLGRAGDSFAVRTFPPPPPEALGADPTASERIRYATQAEVCRPRAQVESELRQSEQELEELTAAAEEAERAARDLKAGAKASTGDGAPAATRGTMRRRMRVRPVLSERDNVSEDRADGHEERRLPRGEEHRDDASQHIVFGLPEGGLEAGGDAAAQADARVED